MTVAFRERLAAGEELNDLLVEAFAVVREAAWRTIGQRHFDVQLMGGMALHFGWIAEMKTGEGKTLVSTLAAYLNALEGKGVHIVTVNDYLAQRDSEWMGRIFRFLGLEVGLVVSGASDFEQKRAAYARRHHLRHQHRVRLRLPARQHGDEPRPDGAARLQLRDRRRGRLDPHRRGPHPAHHLGSVGGLDAALLPVRERRPDPRPRRRLRGRRGEADRRPDRSRNRQGRAPARCREPLRRGRGELRPPARQGARGQGALPPGQGLHRRRRRGEDRRRVHRPDPRRAPLVRRPAPGRRGERARADPRGEPHLGDGDAAELLPHVREARRHDRNGRDRGRGVRLDLRPRGRPDPDEPGDGPRRPRRPHLQDRGGASSRRSSTTSSSATRRASRSSSAPPRSRSPSSSRGCSTSRASRTPS